MKRILIFLLCAVLALGVLVGCNQQSGTETTAEPTVTTQPESFDPAKLTINGVPLEQYTIVYAADGKTSPRRSNNAWIVESGKMADAAEQFSDALFELTGKRLSVVPESEKETEYEIILGKANRKAAKNYYNSTNWNIEKYAYGVYENKLILAGGSSNACYFAGMAFIDACKALPTCDFSGEMVKGEAELITIACIGDSITDGAGQLDSGASNNRDTHSYPIFLQKLLGFGYYVGNYGYSGRMMIDFSLTENFLLSVQAAPDVVIMMLGTNDCNPNKNPDWGKDTFPKTYKDAADSMLARYRSANKGCTGVYYDTAFYHPGSPAAAGAEGNCPVQPGLCCGKRLHAGGYV